MPKNRMVDLSKAHPWWALAKDGRILGDDGPMIWNTEEAVRHSLAYYPSRKIKPVRVYLVVEDD